VLAYNSECIEKTQPDDGWRIIPSTDKRLDEEDMSKRLDEEAVATNEESWRYPHDRWMAIYNQ
jgi:hypothetical protein